MAEDLKWGKYSREHIYYGVANVFHVPPNAFGPQFLKDLEAIYVQDVAEGDWMDKLVEYMFENDLLPTVTRKNRMIPIMLRFLRVLHLYAKEKGLDPEPVLPPAPKLSRSPSGGTEKSKSGGLPEVVRPGKAGKSNQ